jgi:hypothetical protein
MEFTDEHPFIKARKILVDICEKKYLSKEHLNETLDEMKSIMDDCLINYKKYEQNILYYCFGVIINGLLKKHRESPHSSKYINSIGIDRYSYGDLWILLNKIGVKDKEQLNFIKNIILMTVEYAFSDKFYEYRKYYVASSSLLFHNDGLYRGSFIPLNIFESSIFWDVIYENKICDCVGMYLFSHTKSFYKNERGVDFFIVMLYQFIDAQLKYYSYEYSKLDNLIIKTYIHKFIISPPYSSDIPFKSEESISIKKDELNEKIEMLLNKYYGRIKSEHVYSFVNELIDIEILDACFKFESCLPSIKEKIVDLINEHVKYVENKYTYIKYMIKHYKHSITPKILDVLLPEIAHSDIHLIDEYDDTIEILSSICSDYIFHVKNSHDKFMLMVYEWLLINASKLEITVRYKIYRNIFLSKINDINQYIKKNKYLKFIELNHYFTNIVKIISVNKSLIEDLRSDFKKDVLFYELL